MAPFVAPEQLRGKAPATVSGRRVFFDYNTGAGGFRPLDVSFVTFTTIERISTFTSMTLETWTGPVSMAFYARNLADVDKLDSFLATFARFKEAVTIHVVFPKSIKEAFPINMLRNLAESQATTTHVFHCDIDMVPSRFFYPNLMYFPSLSHSRYLEILIGRSCDNR